MGATRSFEVCSNPPAPIDVFEPITALRIAPCCKSDIDARSQKYSTLSACRAIALRRRAQRWTFVTQMKEAKNEIQLNAERSRRSSSGSGAFAETRCRMGGIGLRRAGHRPD